MGTEKSKLKFKKNIKKVLGRFFSIALVLFTAIIFFNLSFAQFQTLTPPPPSSQLIEGPQQPASTPDGRPITPTSLPAPKILSPKNGEVVSGDKVILKWTAVPGATLYSYEMSYRQPSESDFITSGVPAGSSSRTSAEFNLTDISDGMRIRWIVSGSNMTIGQGGWVSEEAEFVYKKSGKEDASTKQFEEEIQAQQKKLASVKAAKVKQNRKAVSCINRYLKFAAPSKYAMSIYQYEGALCPRLSFIPPTTHNYWDEELAKTIYENGPQITIEVYTPRDRYETGVFIAEKMEEGASMKTIKGDTWYYLKLTENTGKGLIAGESYEAFNDKNQIRFTIYLDLTDPGKDLKTLKKVKSDFKKMMKSVTINHGIPSKIEPAVALTKEMLLLQGTWKQIETFFPDDPSIGYPPVKAHLIAFQLDKICSFIQEENTYECYTKYVPYKLTENVLVFTESGSEYRWEILKNTASELEILDHNGTKNIFQKTSSKAPFDR